MAKFILYHNPRCSKSRQALAVLEAAGSEIEIVDYQANPLSRAVITKLLDKVGGDPMALLRVKDAKYKAAGLDPKKALTKKQVLDVLVKHPHLMERPVVEKGDSAVIGRPVDNVEAFVT